jgi:hypothetical protein
MADAERALREQVKKAQARDIAEAFVDADQFHDAATYSAVGIFLNKNISGFRNVTWTDGARVTVDRVRNA